MPSCAFQSFMATADTASSGLMAGLRLHRAPIPEEEPLPGEEPTPDEEELPPHPDPSLEPREANP